LRWPGLLRRQDAENRHLARQYVPEAFWANPALGASVKERIFAQVALGSLVTDLLAALGVRPDAALGYSLGESAMLFGLRAWLDGWAAPCCQCPRRPRCPALSWTWSPPPTGLCTDGRLLLPRASASTAPPGAGPTSRRPTRLPTPSWSRLARRWTSPPWSNR